jgi:hypothetical protein
MSVRPNVSVPSLAVFDGDCVPSTGRSTRPPTAIGFGVGLVFTGVGTGVNVAGNTAVGLGVGDGLGEGDGVGLGDGVGVGDGVGLGDGELVGTGVMNVFVIRQEGVPPLVTATPTHPVWSAVYPLGMASVAVQVAPAVKPVIVKLPGVSWLTGPLAGADIPPLVQVTVTVTEDGLLSEKFLLTVRVALPTAISVFVIVQDGVPPLTIETLAQLSDSLYPLGTASVAVQVALVVKPVIVNVRGLAWLTVPPAGEGVPLFVQVTVTMTEAPLLSEKFLLTVSVAVCSVFVIVQFEVPPLLMAMPAHPGLPV